MKRTAAERLMEMAESLIRKAEEIKEKTQRSETDGNTNQY